MQRQLTPTEVEAIQFFRDNDGQILGSETKKYIGYDLVYGDYYYLNKNIDNGSKISFFKDKIAISAVIKEQFEKEDVDIKADGLFCNAVINSIKARRIVFDPQNPEFYEIHGDRFYNTFSSTESMLSLRDVVKADVISGRRREIKQEDMISVLKEKTPYTYILLRNLTNGDNEALNYYINWLSSVVKLRGKVMTAVGFVGLAEGTGKGVFENLFIRKFYGEQMLATISNKELNSGFNGIFDDKLFVILNEIESSEKMDSRVAEDIKMIVTDEYMTIRRLYKDPIMKKTFFNVQMFTNNLAALKLKPNDRRWSLIKTSDTKLDVIADAMGVGILKFIEVLKAEVLDFWTLIMLYQNDLEKAKKTLDTELKNNLIENTTSKLELVCKKILSKDLKWLSNEIDDSVYGSRNLKMFNAHQFEKELAEDFEKNRISNNTVIYIYKMLIDQEEEKVNVISNRVQLYLGKSYSTNGKRYRNLSSNKIDGDFLTTMLIDTDKLVKKEIVELETEEEFVSKYDGLCTMDNLIMVAVHNMSDKHTMSLAEWDNVIKDVSFTDKNTVYKGKVRDLSKLEKVLSTAIIPF